MNKKLKNIIDEFFKKKSVNTLLIILIVIGFLLVAVNVIMPSKNKEKGGDAQALSELEKEIQKETKIKDDYEREQNEQLKSILQKIDGVGNVDVMIRFESGDVKVPAYDNNIQTSVVEETDGEGGKRTNKQENDGSRVVMATDDKKNEPFVLKTYKPKVEGIIVVAEGAENSKTKWNIEKAVSDLYNISAGKVNVYSMDK